MPADIDKKLAEEIAATQQIEALPTILEVVCRSTGMGFSALARVTDSHWVACQVRDEIAFGLAPGDELVLSSTICDEIRQSHEVVVIDHVDRDPVYAAHHTPLMYGFQSYISMPVFRRNGDFFGTLCAIDPHPRVLNTPQIVGMFKLFSELISFHLHTQEQLSASTLALDDERRTAELREQFIAVLGHDLRNPLASIHAGSELLRRGKPERWPATLNLIDRSVKRMSGLIDNILDFARGRLGGGLALTCDSSEALQPILEQVVAELRATAPEREIRAHFNLQGKVHCDTARLAQLLSNLLANALSHGAPDQPIEVRAESCQEMFELCVTNRGPAIPPERLKNLFQPFFREASQSNQQGLGLGLYIVSEIAHAHGGTLDVRSDAELTCFTFRMPIERA